MFELPNGLFRTKHLRHALQFNSTGHDGQRITAKAENQNRDGAVGIEHAELFAMNDRDAMLLFATAFDPELIMLQAAWPTVEKTPPRSTEFSDEADLLSPSKLLYDQNFAEVDRTIVGMLALKWLIADDYEAFTGHQIPAARLRRDSFEQLRALFMHGLKTQEDVYTLLVATVVNDLGKNPNLTKQVTEFLKDYPPNPNHDMIVCIAAEHGKIPLIDEADNTASRAQLLQGLRFGSEVNIAQLAQAENVPGDLKHVAQIMAGREHSFDLKFMELILDVAGADGHHDARCAKSMIEPVFQGYMVARQALLDIVNQKCSPREGYDQVLSHRGDLLSKTGFRSLSVNSPGERALLRLLTMSRTTTQEQAEWVAEAFSALPAESGAALIDGLNVDGVEDGVAIVPYYMPALFSEVLKLTYKRSAQTKTDCLAALMRFLVRILAGTKPQPGVKGSIVETNLAFVQDTIRSPGFINDPNLLDTLEIPMT
ncbi:hypothetical protein MMC19_004192 [Ptychographa xylographoides]|nr:hypothetical protein [Ptychographa xylographoides]